MFYEKLGRVGVVKLGLDILNNNEEKFREIMTTWIRMVEKRQHKKRKERKLLVEVTIKLPDNQPPDGKEANSMAA